MRERSRVFALTGDDVVRFELDGARASDPSSLLRGVGARCLAIDPRDPDRLYVGTLDSGLYASDDGGLSWRDGNDGLDHRRVLSVAVSPSHQESGISVVYAGTEPSNLYRSEDGGRRVATIAGAARVAQRTALVVPAPAVDPSRAHDRASPDRSRLARGRDRARRRDALARRRRLVDRP